MDSRAGRPSGEYQDHYENRTKRLELCVSQKPGAVRRWQFTSGSDGWTRLRSGSSKIGRRRSSCREFQMC
jgi:hypothetical protein